jgi:CheY-like chemotaxis protein
VESVPGQGSTFSFTLPLGSSTTNDPSKEPADGDDRYVSPALRGRILVVENDRINQRVIGHFLKQMGLEVVFVGDGYEAVHSGTTAPWDAILMDCQLPGLDGLEATRQIRGKLANRTLPIIALTANASTADRAACLDAGMDDFLTKPVRRELLAATLSRWLKESPANHPA